jgi:predicted metal-dependent hydrolase
MTDISMSWNKKVSLREIAMFYENKLRELQGKQDAMINNLNEQHSRLQEKMKELDGKVAEYQKQMDKDEEVLDLFTSTSKERVESLLRKLADEIRLDVVNRLEKHEKLIEQRQEKYEKLIDQREERGYQTFIRVADVEIRRKVRDVIDEEVRRKFQNLDARGEAYF